MFSARFDGGEAAGLKVGTLCTCGFGSRSARDLAAKCRNVTRFDSHAPRAQNDYFESSVLMGASLKTLSGPWPERILQRPFQALCPNFACSEVESRIREVHRKLKAHAQFYEASSKLRYSASI